MMPSNPQYLNTDNNLIIDHSKIHNSQANYDLNTTLNLQSKTPNIYNQNMSFNLDSHTNLYKAAVSST